MTLAFALIGVGWAGPAHARHGKRRSHRHHGKHIQIAPRAVPRAAPAAVPAAFVEPGARSSPPSTTSTSPSAPPALAVSPPSASAAAPAPSPARPARAAFSALFGRVQFVTEKRAYLDRGTADGISAGQSLPFARGGRVVGTCTIASAGDHEATCVGGRPRVGDTFRPGRHSGRRARPPVPTLPPLDDDSTLDARAALIADAPVPKVEFNGQHAFHGRSTVEVSPGFGVWFTQPSANGGTYAQERIDAAIRGVPLGRTGFLFDGAFSAIRWSTPGAAERFRPGTPAQFYLWQAEATRRLQEGGTTVAVGRLWPYHTPGLTLLDGIQIGRQNEARTREAGVYGGLIPSADSLAPTFNIVAAGLYGALSQVGEKTSLVRLARQELRLGVWRGTDAGAVTEAEGLAQLWIGAVTAGGGGRLRWAPTVDRGRPVLERASVDLGVRPGVDTRAGLHLRYLGATLWPDAPLRGELPMTGGALHAIADLQISLSPGLAIAASAGAHREDVTGRHQIHAGGEVRFPRLFRGAGGLWLGAEVEQGWVQGENLYLQWVGHYSSRVQMLARLSINGTRFATPTAVANLDELGGYLNIDGALSSWLRLRAWSLLRAPLLVQGTAPSETSIGAVAGLSLAGSI